VPGMLPNAWICFFVNNPDMREFRPGNQEGRCKTFMFFGLWR